MNRTPLTFWQRLDVVWSLLRTFGEDANGKPAARVRQLGEIVKADIRATMRGERVPFPVDCSRCGHCHSDDCWIDPCPRCGNIHTGDWPCEAAP
jgi:hypothetical protein